MSEVPPARLQPDGRIDEGGFGRVSRVPAVRVGLDTAATAELNEHPGSTDLARLVDPQLLSEVDSLLAAESFPPARPKEADVGRGYSAGGIVIEILDTIDLLGGVASAIVLSAAAIRRIHRIVSRRVGHATTISLGAAEYLAAADLVGRVGDGEPLRLVGSGDVDSRPSDSSFIGGDAYWIIFSATGRLHHYQVD